MSAIVGIYRLKAGSPTDRDLNAMLDAMEKRGPNGKGLWKEGPIGLGHRMLWTTPESLTEIQPLKNNSSDIIITADARIDNRDELIKELYLTNIKDSIADSELILHAYEAWGEECLSKIIGDYAFAIWDSRKEELFCARDQMGIKPFYYFLSDDLFVFSTEIKAILCLQETPRKVNEIMIRNFLLRDFSDRAITFFEGISRLPAAHSITIKDNGFNIERYWSLEAKGELYLPSDDEYAMRFKDIFEEAVRCRLRSAFPVGAQLSGGLDSSSIVCVADDLSPDHENSLTFSAVFERTPECDESQYIKAVADKRGVPSQFIIADRISPLGDVPSIIEHIDEPILIMNVYLSLNLCKAAKERGIRAFFSGEDGDTVVSHGFELLTQLAHLRKPEDLAKAFEDISKIQNLNTHELALKYCILPFANGKIKELAEECPSHAYDFINTSFYERAKFKDRIDELNSSREFISAQESHLHAISSGYSQYILEFLDQISALYQMEFRYPFYDIRLIEFCLSLPPDQKLKNGWSRWILRSAMSNILPSEVQWRQTKSDLSQNFINQLHDVDLDLVKRALDCDIAKRYFDRRALEKIYDKFKSEPSVEEAQTLWIVAFLLLWLQKEHHG
jgi:asparagine synthase (glutamine-hydrolysing)